MKPALFCPEKRCRKAFWKDDRAEVSLMIHVRLGHGRWAVERALAKGMAYLEAARLRQKVKP